MRVLCAFFCVKNGKFARKNKQKRNFENYHIEMASIRKNVILKVNK